MRHIQRVFIPGSHWIYLKLYTGQKSSDELLIKVISPVLKKLQKKQILKKWFFIRYTDPDFHLRIRLLIVDNRKFGEVIHLFYEQLEKKRNNYLLWKVQLDTYSRELERYNKHLIEEAESIFYIDSECILSIIKKLNRNENYRWMIALKLIDEFLSDFNLNIEEKQHIMKNLSKSYKNEFGFNEYNSKQFNSKFRENRSVIEGVLNNTIKDIAFTSILKPIGTRTKKSKPIFKQLVLNSKRHAVINELLKSYLHMMINRLFPSNNRMHEMILYDFMFRYYSSEIAKRKYLSDKV